MYMYMYVCRVRGKRGKGECVGGCDCVGVIAWVKKGVCMGQS